ncbi:MAG: pyrimidine dimer DNA glycosylase/endonuclease V [Candidatus Altiarchaeota archaeon]
MRIWDIPPGFLCRQHLLGEHRELHAVWNIITEGKKGYSHHPETLRWSGKLNALYLRHEQLVREIVGRGYCHHSPLDRGKAWGKRIQRDYVDSLEEQRRILKGKRCGCRV